MTMNEVSTRAETDEPYDVADGDAQLRWWWPLGALCSTVLLFTSGNGTWSVPAALRFIWSAGGLR